MKSLFLFLIIFLALFFRFNNLNWDQNFHLHPDERFLTMVTQSMRLPQSAGEYFNQKKSFLNPSNIGFNFYVYGTFPLVLTKYLAVNFGMDNYNQITFLGRFLSALADFLIVVLVYKTAKILLKEILKLAFRQTRKAQDNMIERVSLFSAFFYAISVYPIQSAHFFTTDTFLNFFMFGSFYFILKTIKNNRFILYFLLSSLFFALALASKISALYILPLNLGVLFLILVLKNGNLFKNVIRYLLYVILYLLFSYLFLRIFNPYYFEKLSFFDLELSKVFVESIKELKFFNTKEPWYPPGVQWINKPWYGLFLTTFLVCLGPINFIICFVGLVYLLINSKLKIQISKLKLKIKNFIIFLIILWIIGYFIYQSSQFIKSIRYTIYLYPFFAIFGGVGMSKFELQSTKFETINKLFKYLKIKKLEFVWDLGFRIWNLLIVLLLIWPLLFSTIYFYPHTRVEASEWIYKNLRNESTILGEHWDDPLPLPMEKNYGKTFQVELLPVFDQDNPEKWEKIKELLQKSDYYVLSSNRGWGSISTVPNRYPLMSQYYQALLNSDCEKQKKLVGVCYKKIKTFEPYYYKFIKYPDSWVEETFTVYDHPTVLIYEKI